MKKFLAAIILILLLAQVCACGSSAKTESDPKMIFVNGLDSQTDLNRVRMIGALGSASMSDKGVCVTVSADPYSAGFTTDTAALYLAFSSEFDGTDYTDFSDVEFVVFDAYNESAEPLTLDLRLVYSDMDLGRLVNVSKCNLPETFTLAPQGWTQVAYPIRRELIPVTEGTDALTVKGMYVEFPTPQTDTKYYLNDLRLYTTDKPVPELSIEVPAGEVCSFDAYWQTDLVCVDYYWDIQLIPQIRRDTTVTADGIGASLKVTAKAGSSDASVSQRYPGILLDETLIGSVDWASYPETAKFCFDIYAPKEGGLNRVFCSLYTDNTRYFSGPSVYTMPGQWITASYTIEELNKAATAEANFAKTTRIYLRWSEFTGSDKVFYLDNFRIEMP